MAKQPINPALSNIVDQTNALGSGRKSEMVPPHNPKKCLKLTIPLSKDVFYLPDVRDGGKYGLTELGFKMDFCFSEGVGSLFVRHEHVTFVGTGFVMEEVDKPDWWPKEMDAKVVTRLITGRSIDA